MARPQWGSSWEKVEEHSLEIMIALDTSKSMLASDFKPTRLQQAKWGIRDLIKVLRSDRLGLIAFSGSAFLQCPPTSDYAAFDMMLEDLYAGIIPVGGTDVSEALRCALDSFDDEEQPDTDRVLILISDGESHTGDALSYIAPLKQAGIRIYGIGVGTPGGELIYTDEGFIKNQSGEMVKSRLIESQLETLSRETGGFYLRGIPGNLGLEHIYEVGIAPLQRGLRDEEWREVRTERFPIFIGIALFVLFIEQLVTTHITEPSL
jgi:Ca-activated chloride channel family protein